MREDGEVSGLHQPPTPDVWVGVDVGTQSIRVAAVDDTGIVVGSGSHPLTGVRDGPRHEQDPRLWWSALTSAVQAAMRTVEARRVGGLAIDATSGTILLADPGGIPLTAGLMYDDARATIEAEEVNAAGEDVWRALGYQRMQPAWALPKLVWLLRHRPELARRSGTRLLHQADLLTWWLTGGPTATDASHALKTGYHLVDERWPREVFDELDIPDGLLPAVRRPGSVLGTVCPDAAEQTGLPVRVPVVAGMTDGCAAQLGAGALEVGSWNSVLGTTLVLKGVTDQLILDPGGVVYSHRSPDGHWLPGGASSTGAGVLPRLFPGRDLAALDQAASQCEPASVVAYPLVSTGERFPFVAPEAEPFVLGEPRDEVDRYAAILQGVAFIERLCFDYLDRLGARADGAVSFTGGATRSRYWCQLRADVLGRGVRLPDNAEPALGMAVLAAATGSGRSLSDIARNMVRVRAVVEPAASATRFAEPYLHLVDELVRRGWLDADVATHAHARAPH